MKLKTLGKVVTTDSSSSWVIITYHNRDWEGWADSNDIDNAMTQFENYRVLFVQPAIKCFGNESYPALHIYLTNPNDRYEVTR